MINLPTPASTMPVKYSFFAVVIQHHALFSLKATYCKHKLTFGNEATYRISLIIASCAEGAV